MFRKILYHPLIRDLNIDHRQTTKIRSAIIKKKIFLKKIYKEWYSGITDVLPMNSKPILELGSGPGFLKQFIPGLITSDIIQSSEVDIIMDGCSTFPFSKASLAGIVMVNVFHHLPNVKLFFAEADRCVKKDGIVTMIEPWVTLWSKLIYSRLHHEQFDSRCREWTFMGSNPLSAANLALPWIVFERDRQQCKNLFPNWHIKHIRLLMPFLYLLSGGISRCNIMPGITFRFWENIEKLWNPWIKKWAMFAQITLLKK